MSASTFRTVSLVAVCGVLGAMAAACTKSSDSKKGPPGAAGSARESVESGTVKPRLSPEERLKKDAELEALRAELKAIEGKVSNVTKGDVRVSGEFSLPTAALGKEMLWGSNLQYLDAFDLMTGERTQLKAIVLGSRVAVLERVGDRILVFSRDEVQHESDYPARNVLVEFDVLGEKDGALSLKARNLGMETAQLLGPGTGIGVGIDVKPFVRSLSYDESDGTLLIEYTMRDHNDAQFDVIESLMPRENVVGGRRGVEIEGIEPGRENDVTNFQTLLARLGVFKETSWVKPPSRDDDGPLTNVTKIEKTHVVKYDIDGGKQIEWWVTSNTPDTLMPDIKAGVEGWNRYFNEFRGERPVMVFKGKLPVNARLGDPRYNVVLFDAVADSPAAYESQGTDPLTGIQTHSLIYLPFAWYNLSDLRYLQDGDDSVRAGATGAGITAGSAPSVAGGAGGIGGAPGGRRGVAGKVWENLKARDAVRCEMPTHFRDAGFLLNARLAETADEAGRALVRSTLLHEVGHALGMAHNFKGTLTGEVSEYNENDWIYSSSTMDYNPFAMEDTLFVELSNPDRDVTKGLVQPYDRQFIDIVYNAGRGTADRRERAYPYCDDKRHEDTLDGVDPFCRQYDFFARPEQTLSVPTERLASQNTYLGRKHGGFITMRGWADARGEEVLASLGRGSDAATDGEPTTAELQDAARAYTGELTTAFRHFLRSGSYSYVNALVRDARLLGEWKPFDDVEEGTEISFRTGFEFVSRYVKNLFADSGELSGDAYAAYARKTQAQFASRMAGLFGTGLDSGTGVISGDEKLVAAVSGLMEAQRKVGSALSARVPSADKAALETTLAGLEGELKGALNSNLTAASERVISALGDVVVTSGYTGSAPTGRPAVRGENAHKLSMGLIDLVGRESATVTARTSAIGWLQFYDGIAAKFASAYKVEVKDASGAVSKRPAVDVRADAKVALVASLRAEIAPLDEAVRRGRYLTAEERSLHEFLSQTLEMFGATASATEPAGSVAR